MPRAGFRGLASAARGVLLLLSVPCLAQVSATSSLAVAQGSGFAPVRSDSSESTLDNLESRGGAPVITAGLETSPSWDSEPRYATQAVAVGDVDGDGDLDLVFGNQGESNTLYRNNQGAIERDPLWLSSPKNQTSSIALGDIDGDGDLDLVCGNVRQSNTMYRNEGGTFGLEPVWFSDSTFTTRSIALGDVDGDGDLDLVCGNAGEKSTLYLNDGAGFETQPRWFSGPADQTWSVALGDVDNDGDLDLVCGNLNQSNALYLNDGGYFVFGTQPHWRSFPSNATTSVALGDLDGDGDLDLFCGNTGQRSNLYWNASGFLVFETQPSPLGSAVATYDVTLGDADGDGDLDLMQGNSQEPDRLWTNENGVFERSWFSDLASATTNVVFGDLDADGDLDLIGANTGERNTIYRNTQPVFESHSTWSSGDSSDTRGIALGDVDRDGDLDLVCGNRAKPNTLYKNEGGMLETWPSWSSDRNDTTSSVALGDIDGQGGLDLVFGNHSQEGNTVYLSEDAGVATTPAWISVSAQYTASIALGDLDLDLDGDLDLVCGLYVGRDTPFSNTARVYENRSGMFREPGVWIPSIDLFGTAVVLDDVDGDGRLDLLVSSNRGHLFLNDGTWFGQGSTWTGPGENTVAIDLGDVDGDGDLDLVRGNARGLFAPASTLYLNKGRSPFYDEIAPDWEASSTEFATSSVALADVDGDGDLDLVCGNTNDQGNIYYRNIGGAAIFEVDPAWTSPLASTWDIALGDVDEDGDLDLVSGNQSANTLVGGHSWPSYRHDPQQPTHHLPNNAAHLRRVRTERDPSGAVLVYLTAIDVEGDPIQVLGEYQYAGDARWFPVDLDLSGDLLATSAAGVQHTGTWDTSLLPFDDREIVLRLRVIEVPRHVSLIQHAPVYNHVAVGVVVPRRAELELSQSTLEFPVVTVGDTVTVELQLRNAGNAPLVIDRIDLPSSEMGHDLLLPVELPAGADTTWRVEHTPVADLSAGGDIVIYSNDPAAPEKTIPCIRHAEGLEFTSFLFANEDPVPLAQALTVLVAPAENVRLEGGALHLLDPDENPLASYALEFLGEGWFAIIPAEQVTEAGFRYWIEVWNRPVIETAPPGAPDSSFLVRAQLPNALSSSAEPTSGSAFLEGRAVSVRVTVPEGSVVESGWLHSRRGGEPAFVTTRLDSTAPQTLVGVIPDSMVGVRGLEYWVEVQTLRDTLVHPPAGASAPAVIRTTVQQVQEDSQYAGLTYRMVSLPVDYGSDFQGTLATLLSDQAGFGSYDPFDWRAWRWMPEQKDHVELSQSEPFYVRPGRAFWLIARESNRVRTRVPALSTSTDTSFTIALSPGWNQIGSPFAFPVAWDNVDIRTTTGAVVIGVEPPLFYDATAERYQERAVLRPFEGYFVMNGNAEDVVLHIPLVEWVADSVVVSKGDPGTEWQVEIRASSEGMADVAWAGVAEGAAVGWDAWDRSDPPGVPGRVLSVYFPHTDWETSSRAFAVDVRAAAEPRTSTPEDYGEAWFFDVTKSFTSKEPGDLVVLHFGGLESVPSAFGVVLLDHVLGSATDLRQESEFQCVLGKRAVVGEMEARFELVVGVSSFVHTRSNTLAALPDRTRLLGNHPNPFRRGTLIRYELAEQTRAEIRIFDVRGRLVRSLSGRTTKPGRYELVWDGLNQQGSPVSTGVYFYRLQAGSYSQTLKMLFMR